MNELSELGVSGAESPEAAEARATHEPASLSTRARAAWVLAEEIAGKLDHDQIEPEDLLRALLALAMGDPKMRDMLKEVGLDLDEARLRSLAWSTREEERPREGPEPAGTTET
ncbi:MAG TPA: Clp protease N-terminal domain-containing protein [Actinomycetota bacterium]|nr:Clp protease N-terminal domain-containing protein [Actinomycetota bacterium]